MNSIQQEISKYLSTLSPYVEPIKKECEKYLHYCSIMDGDFSIGEHGETLPFFESISIGHNPCIYWDNYMLTINKGIEPSWLDIFKERTNLSIPKMYADFLLEINGCNLFDLMVDGFTLYGLSPFSYYNKSNTKKHIDDLENPFTRFKGNKSYVGNFYNGFYIGSLSLNEQDILIGYFIVDDKILAVSYGGKIEKEYNNFNDFLINEIELAREFYFSSAALDGLCPPDQA